MAAPWTPRFPRTATSSSTCMYVQSRPYAASTHSKYSMCVHTQAVCGARGGRPGVGDAAGEVDSAMRRWARCDGPTRQKRRPCPARSWLRCMRPRTASERPLALAGPWRANQRPPPTLLLAYSRPPNRLRAPGREWFHSPAPSRDLDLPPSCATTRTRNSRPRHRPPSATGKHVSHAWVLLSQSVGAVYYFILDLATGAH